MKFVAFLAGFLSFQLHAAVIIGTLALNPPYEMSVGKNNFVGFEIDIMQEICRRLRLDCKYKELPSAQLFTQLLTEEIDLAIGSITITDVRKQNFLFSLPFLNSVGQFVALTSAQHIKKPADLIGKRVGFVEGTIFNDFLQKLFNDQVTGVGYHTFGELLQHAENGDVDGFIIDKVVANHWVANNETLFKPLGEPIPLSSTGSGVMANKKAVALIANINQALSAMAADGAYKKIHDLYFSVKPTTPPMGDQ